MMMMMKQSNLAKCVTVDPPISKEPYYQVKSNYHQSSQSTWKIRSTPHTVKFNEYLQSFGLVMHVISPTHNKGGILDVFITRSDHPSPEIFVHAPSISDHSLIEGRLPVQPMTVFDSFSVRTWSKYKKAFQQDLLSNELFSKDADLSEFSVEDLFSKYDSTLRCLLDKHLPVRKVRKRIEPLTPWFDSDCIKAKRNKRRLGTCLSPYWTCCWQSTVD